MTPTRDEDTRVAKSLIRDAAASEVHSAPARNWGAFRKYGDCLEKHGGKSYQNMQTAKLWTIQAKEVKSSLAKVEQNLLLIYTLQEAKPKNQSKHLLGFLCLFFLNSAESRIKNKTRRVRGSQSSQGEGMCPASCTAQCARHSRAASPGRCISPSTPCPHQVPAEPATSSSSKAREGEMRQGQGKPKVLLPHEALAPPALACGQFVRTRCIPRAAPPARAASCQRASAVREDPLTASLEWRK